MRRQRAVDRPAAARRVFSIVTVGPHRRAGAEDDGALGQIVEDLLFRDGGDAIGQCFAGGLADPLKFGSALVVAEANELLAATEAFDFAEGAGDLRVLVVSLRPRGIGWRDGASLT